jgi:predicted amino acid dehydrogenase
MDKFGFIIHPINFTNVYQFFPPSRLFPKFLVKKVLFNLPPFVARYARGIRSLSGNVVEGYFIVCPLLSEQILGSEEEVLFDKVLAAGRLAEKLGVKMLGIGALAAGIGEASQKIAEQLDIGVTNGTSLAGAAVIETVLRVAQMKKFNLGQAKVAIIGATNPIGKICAYTLSKKVAQLSLVAKNQERLAHLVNTLKNKIPAGIENCGINISGAVGGAEVIIFTTTALEVIPGVRIEDLRQGAVICDIPTPRNISPDMARLRPDLLIIDAAAVELPYPIKLNLHLGLADGQVYACMAETMILTLEGVFGDFSIGWEPSLDKVETISRLAQKHGFKPAFTSFGKKIA